MSCSRDHAGKCLENNFGVTGLFMMQLKIVVYKYWKDSMDAKRKVMVVYWNTILSTKNIFYSFARRKKKKEKFSDYLVSLLQSNLQYDAFGQFWVHFIVFKSPLKMQLTHNDSDCECQAEATTFVAVNGINFLAQWYSFSAFHWQCSSLI